MIPLPPAVVAFLSRWWPVVGVAILALIVLPLAYCSGRSDGKTGEVVKQQGREIETQRDLGNASDAAGDQRIQDMLNVSNQAEELKNATRADETAEQQRIRRGCIILRQQGRPRPAVCND